MSNPVISIGILRETIKTSERRVPLTPWQISRFMKDNPQVRFVVQPSGSRCFTDDEYRQEGIVLCEDLSGCQLLMGIKEVNPYALIPGKTYAFFAHVAKKQPHNQRLLQYLIRKKNSLIDYEFITNDQGSRLIAFGRWAGIVGAYNGIRAWGLRYDAWDIKPAWQCGTFETLKKELAGIRPGKMKILITGEGRVASGAVEIMNLLGIRRVKPSEFLSESFEGPVYCQIGPQYYTRRTDGKVFDFRDFVQHPDAFISAFMPFMRVTDLLITGHYWDPKSPRLFTIEELTSGPLRCKIIADISCDINGSVPTTIRAASVEEPFYDVDPLKGEERKAFSHSDNITVMAVDNLPAELPRDASEDFGNALLEYFLPEYLKTYSPLIERATIVREGELTQRFLYLADYAGVSRKRNFY